MRVEEWEGLKYIIFFLLPISNPSIVLPCVGPPTNNATASNLAPDQETDFAMHPQPPPSFSLSHLHPNQTYAFISSRSFQIPTEMRKQTHVFADSSCNIAKTKFSCKNNHTIKHNKRCSYLLLRYMPIFDSVLNFHVSTPYVLCSMLHDFCNAPSLCLQPSQPRLN
jgi:hypothetical protein